MKKHSLITVLAAALVGVSAAGFPAAPGEPAGIVAEAAVSGNWQYTVSSNQVTITGYTGSATSVTIPDKINGKKVVAIGDNAFCPEFHDIRTPKNITSVTIPNTVKTIGENAFYRVPLTGLVLPSSVTTVGDRAFHDNSALTNLTIQGGAHLGKHAFSYCTSLTRATLHKDVTGEQHCFSWCQSLNLLNGQPVYREVPDGNGYWYPMITQNQNTRKVLQNAFSHCEGVKFITDYSAALADYVVESEVKDWMSEAVKARQLHDWLIRHCDYEDENDGETLNDWENHTAEGLFFSVGLNIRGNSIGETVCEGFSKAYTALLTKAGIEAYTLNESYTPFGSSYYANMGIGGGSHAWNLVKVDGAYYQVDVTADECASTGTAISYQYFLKSNATIVGLDSQNGQALFNTPSIEGLPVTQHLALLNSCTDDFADANLDGIRDRDYNFNGVYNYSDIAYLIQVSPFFTNGFSLNQSTQSVWLQYLLAVDKSPSEILYLAQHGGHI